MWYVDHMIHTTMTYCCGNIEIRNWSISGECFTGLLYICSLSSIQVSICAYLFMGNVYITVLPYSETTDSALFDKILELVAGMLLLLNVGDYQGLIKGGRGICLPSFWRSNSI